MNFELTGKLIVKYGAKNVSKNPEKPFMKGEFVVETTESNNGMEFKEQIILQSTGDRATIIDAFNIGDTIKVVFNVRGRGWRKVETDPMRYFNNLEAWKVEKVEDSQKSFTNDVPPLTEEDDLPF